MFSAQGYYLVMMGVAILLPLIPALLLFWLLPSDASVSGPFKGMKFKLGGAFAGYFVLFVALQYYFPAPELQRYQVWHVKGRYTLEGHPDALVASEVLIDPPDVNVAGQTFTLDIPVDSDEAGKPKFPSLMISHAPCHGNGTIDLGLAEQGGFGGTSAKVAITRNEKTHELDIDGIHLGLDPKALRPDGTKCVP